MRSVLVPAFFAYPFLSEGLRPSDSPTRSLARRFAGALLSRGSLRCARSPRLGTSSPGPPYTLSRAPLRRRAPFAWLASLRSLAAPRDFVPGPPYTLACADPFAPRRSRGSLAALFRRASGADFRYTMVRFGGGTGPGLLGASSAGTGTTIGPTGLASGLKPSYDGSMWTAGVTFYF